MKISLCAISILFLQTISTTQSETKHGPSAYRKSVDINIPSDNASDKYLRIAFGSCYGIWDFKSNIFETIVKDKPDVWIWLGDVAYVDADDFVSLVTFDDVGTSAKHIEYKFSTTKEGAAGYPDLMKQTRIIGVWDDHDFGINDGGREFKLKDQNRDLWLDFIDEPKDS